MWNKTQNLCVAVMVDCRVQLTKKCLYTLEVIHFIFTFWTDNFSYTSFLKLKYKITVHLYNVLCFCQRLMFTKSKQKVLSWVCSFFFFFPKLLVKKAHIGLMWLTMWKLESKSLENKVLWKWGDITLVHHFCNIAADLQYNTRNKISWHNLPEL